MTFEELENNFIAEVAECANTMIQMHKSKGYIKKYITNTYKIKDCYYYKNIKPLIKNYD